MNRDITLRLKRWPELLGRLFFGFYFILAAYPKIMHPAEFAAVIRRYQILPDSLSNLPAIILPWLELFVGLFLLAGIMKAATRFWGLFLLVLFTLMVTLAFARGFDMDCGCGVALFGDGRIGWRKVLENTGLSLIYYFLLLHKPLKTKSL